jgi:hypothetical protein
LTLLLIEKYCQIFLSCWWHLPVSHSFLIVRVWSPHQNCIKFCLRPRSMSQGYWKRFWCVEADFLLLIHLINLHHQNDI